MTSPSASKIADEQSQRSLMFGENARLVRVAAISSAIETSERATTSVRIGSGRSTSTIMLPHMLNDEVARRIDARSPIGRDHCCRIHLFYDRWSGDMSTHRQSATIAN